MKLLTGKQIKKKREDHGLSQSQLARKIDLKAASYISFFEGGYRPEDLTPIKQITELLNKPVPKDVAAKVAEKRARAKAAAKRRAKKAAQG